MTSAYAIIGPETLKKGFNLILTAMRGYKPMLDYEQFLLLETDKDSQTLSLRISNQRGDLHVALRGQKDFTSLAIQNNIKVAINTNSLTTVLPFLKGSIEISSVVEHPGEISFKSGAVTQQLPWSSTIVHDFPHILPDMDEWVRFTCPDFARRLRLGSSSASHGKFSATTITGGTFFQVHGRTISMESADPVRGVSRMLWDDETIQENGTSFAYVIPQVNIEALARVAQDYHGEIVVTSDPRGGMVRWSFGDITYVTRSLGDKFHNISVMYTGIAEASASVPYEEFRDILGLIKAQTQDKVLAKASIQFLEDGKVFVTSPSTDSLTSGEMNGMCSGKLPHTFLANADQILGILSDIKTKGVIHLYVHTIKGRPFLKIVSPDDPAFVHVALLMTDMARQPAPESED